MNEFHMTPEEEKAYENMISIQSKKLDVDFFLKQNIITQTYINSFMMRKKIICPEVLEIPEKTKNLIYKLYIAGVLPMRLGGI